MLYIYTIYMYMYISVCMSVYLYICLYYNLFKGLFPWVNTQSFLTVTYSGFSNEVPGTK